MIKRVIWAFIHTNKMNPAIALPNASRHPLNFMSNELIKELIKSDLPEKNKDRLNLEKIKHRLVLRDEEFKCGAIEGYKVVLSEFARHGDFVSSTFCTPQLSFTLNFLNFRMRNIGIDQSHEYAETAPTVTATILGYWVEMQETRSNNKILGMWDIGHIKREIFAGIQGPEVKIMSDEVDEVTYIPVKQTVRVAYAVSYDNVVDSGCNETDSDSCSGYERLDVFDWERSLSCPVEDEEWTVSNINSVLI
mmetsp:Transcript_9139/g.15427  ORF Transcript_9139/g.15427 Transcript_9139/m.15427 type:complete len:249 (-) Transcript_9139:118-864(-)